ncbi:membrane protein of ER body-like protein [Prosopis cineraria]|uniref:membrane protein of ER body-like protein n=1 Tax=Prosopis cineraria TaxID=364024 RepID=UPI00240ED19B|nr:membrane protein of ER body-like protein [Prosopis cineraria]
MKTLKDNSSEVNDATVQHLDGETSPTADPELIEDFDQRLRELDVEAVLAKQATHDLFCPNCNSCITKRVILRKRKRRVQDLDLKAKRDKLDTVVSSKLVDDPAFEANRSDEAVTTNIEREVPSADSYGHEGEPEVFRCLSCFRYFIPTGSFNLFRKFVGTRENESSQNSSSLPTFDSHGSSRLHQTDEKNLSNIPASNSNWFFSLFTSNERKTASDMIPKHTGDLSATKITSEKVVKAEDPAEDPALKPYAEEPENSEKEMYKKSSMETAEFAKNATSDMQTVGGYAEYFSEHDLPLAEKEKTAIEEEKSPPVRTEKKGSEVIVLVEPVESTATQTEDSVIIEGTILTERSAQTQAHNGEQTGDVVRKPYGREILKSIVYSGLVESISSLGVVTSAASAGSSSMNIIALGLANLVGGLFIIWHHLTELKEDSQGDTQQTNGQEDKYQRLLGHRENFVLHAVVVVLSFLIFGSVPVVIYGILIGENYSSEVKVALVVAASLLCVILLGIAKVYTKRPPKSYAKTVSYYVTLAVATSGVSYVAGRLMKDLIEKLSELESGFAILMPISDTAEREPPWTSY